MELFESRKRLLNNLYSLLTSISDNKNALSVSIDAGWGYGKTFFLEKLSSVLKNDKQIVVNYNAWENDISDDAFISFTDSLISGLHAFIEEPKFIDKANSIFEAFGRASLKTISEKVAIIDAVTGIAKETQKELDTIKEKESGFFNSGIEKTKLTIVKDRVNESLNYFFSNCKSEYKDKKIFVLVDELDRCRPDFAIQVLERLKHLFSNPNLCFVFAINRTQLQLSVSHCFGKIDCSLYLEKFFDFSFVLPEPNVDEFLRIGVSFSGNKEQKRYYDLLCQLIRDAGDNVSLRIIEKIISHFNIICNIVDNFEESFRTPYIIPIAIFSNVADNEFFRDIIKTGNLEHYYDDKYDKYRFIYKGFKYYSSDKLDEGTELLGNIQNEYSYNHYPGAYISKDNKLFFLGQYEHVYLATKNDLLKVFDLVASLA